MVCSHLLLGPSFDAHVELVAEQLARSGCRVDVLATDGPLPDLDELAARPPCHALFRRAQGAGHPDAGVSAYMDTEVLEYLTALGELTPHWHWFPGTPAQVRRTGSKPLQLWAARQAGLAVPRTVITSDATALEGFDEHGAVIKPLRSQTITIGGAHHWLGTSSFGGDEAALALAPAIVQHRLDRAAEVRVFVTAQQARAFVAEVGTGRYADLKDVVDDASYRTIDLPIQVETRLRALMAALGAPFACADFVLDHGDTWWFLELNPNGQWYFLEEDTGVNLVSAFLDGMHAG